MVGADQNLLKAEQLLEEASKAEVKNTEEALKIANQAKEIAVEFNLENVIAKCDMRKGRCHWISGNFDLAIKDLSESLELATKLEDHETQAEALIGLGNVYITMELIDQAIVNYNAALEVVEDKALDDQKTKIYNNLGTLHEDLRNFEKALEYYQKSYDMAKKTQDDYGEAIAHLNIGNVYLKSNHLKEAYENIKTAHSHAKKNQQHLFLAHCYYALGQYYQTKNDYKQSIIELKQGILSAEESNDFYILIRIHLELANAFDNIKKVDEAKKYFEKAFTFAKQMNSKEFMPKVHEQLANFYERNHFKEEAFLHYKAYHDSNKIVQENRRIERIKTIEFQTKLESAVKESNTYRKLTSELRKNYKQMKVLSEIGRSLTATNQIEEIYDQLYENINKLMNANVLLVGFFNEETSSIDFNLKIENNVKYDKFSLSLNNENSLAVYSFSKKRSLKIDNVKKEYQHYIKEVSTSSGGMMLSAMYAPLVVENKAIGVLSIQAKNKATYNETHQVLFETLASYLAIALNNALHSKELARLNQKFKSLSEKDGLTGIPNRRIFDQQYKIMWNNASIKQIPLSMIFVDVDDFKDFNDYYGHLVGDEVIRKVAQFLQDFKDDDMFLARYGGDEFVILCHLDEKEVIKFSDKLKRQFEDNVDVKNINDSLSISMGIGTIIPDKEDSGNKFLNFVDTQLYESKSEGKDKVTFKNYKE